MSSGCPADNSTEAIACLLRLVADNTQPDWNWDPLSFGVTAAIGVLALIVAGITVFQGLLAAGPGRIKASRPAIGPFAIHSRSVFDRTELALRTTARVPLITWDVCYHRIVRQKFQPNFEVATSYSQLHPGRLLGADPFALKDHVEESGASRSPRGQSTTSFEQGRHEYDSTATWLTLLTSLGLEDPQFFPLVQRVTDYLPTDIQAAPAAGELRCLAILAVIADTNASIELSGPGNRFPRVLADSSSLVFRDHPSLGTVAAYEAYEETAVLKVGDSPPLEFGSQFPALKFEDLDRCLQLASGRLAYADGRIPPSLGGQADTRTFLTLIKDLWERSRGCGHDVCEHAYQDWEASLRDMQERRDGWMLYGQMKMFYMVASLMTADRANLCRGFPKEKMKFRESVVAILKLDEFWSTEMTFQKAVQLQKLAYLTFRNPRWVPTKSKLSASWVVDFTTVQSTISNPFSEGYKVMERQHFKEDKTMLFMQAVRAAITKWVLFDKESPEVFDRSKPSAQSIAMLLACLDEWLLRCAGHGASCSMLKTLHLLGTQMQICVVARRDLDQEASFWSFAGEQSIPQMKSKTYNGFDVGKIAELVEKYGLDSVHSSTLLVLRGVLMALLIDDGADTSILYEPQFRNSVVRML